MGKQEAAAIGRSGLTWWDVQYRYMPRLVKIVRRITAYLIMITIVLTMIFPFIWMIFSSLKPDTENYTYPPTFFPQTITFENYHSLLKRTHFSIWFRNSAIVAVAVTISSIALSATAAYSLSRFRYRFFETFGRLILFTYMIPGILLVVPIVKIIYSLKLGDSLFGLFLVENAGLIPYGLWTLRSYFAGIPHEVEESALIDGASRFQAFYKVVLPLALPGLISTALFAFHVSWNQYLMASVLLYSSRKMTLGPGVATLIGAEVVYSWGSLMAAGVLINLPVILIFSILQRFLIAGWGGGAVKT